VSREQHQPDSPPQTNTEAIRRAIAALGAHAQVPEILEYVHQHFGIGGPAGILLPEYTPGRSAPSFSPAIPAAASAVAAPLAPTPPRPSAPATPTALTVEAAPEEPAEAPAGKKATTRRKTRDH
jgi:hypothetical protein